MLPNKHGFNRNIRVLEFLNAYEKQECLWNPALESYKNKPVRDDAYQNIINELNVPSLTINDVKLKVKSIRTTYTKELRLVTKHKELGKPYNPKLFWFNRANNFLKNVSLSRERRRSMNFTKNSDGNDDEYKTCLVKYVSHGDEPMDDSNVENDAGNSTGSSYEYKTLQTSDLIEAHLSDDIEEAEAQSEDDVTTSTKHINNNHHHHPHQHHAHDDYTAAAVSTTDLKFSDNCLADETLHHPGNAILMTTHSAQMGNTTSMATATTTTPISSSVNNIEDDYDLFCRSVAAQLRSINDNYSRSVAKLKIQQILFEAETGHYRQNPCITIPMHSNIDSLQDNC